MSELAATIERLSTQISTNSNSYVQGIGQDGNNSQGTAGASIAEACRELDALLTPPEDWLSRIAGAYNYCAALCLALDLNIPAHLPEKGDGTLSLQALGEKCGASELLLRPLMSLCVEKSLFDEPSPAVFRLNENSSALLNRNFRCWIHYLVDDGFRMGSFLPLYAHTNSYQVPDHKHKTAFELAFQTDRPFYEHFHSADRPRGLRFDSAMERYFHKSAQMPIEELYDFHKLQADATLVDIGGGRGHHSIRLARQFPNMKFIVQDLETKRPTIHEAAVESTMARVTWQEHDFFEEQPVKGAGVYFLSHILMDHSDSECRRIISRLADAMKPHESVLLIDDFLGQSELCTLSPQARTLNFHHLAAFGRPFRTMEEWTKLFPSSSSSGGLYVLRDLVVGNGRVVFEVRRG